MYICQQPNKYFKIYAFICDSRGESKSKATPIFTVANVLAVFKRPAKTDFPGKNAAKRKCIKISHLKQLFLGCDNFK